MICAGMIEDSITKFPKNQKIPNEKTDSRLSRKKATNNNMTIKDRQKKVVMGVNNPLDREKS